ncbi:hypothetical protein [Rhizosaccharibacter radicis]|uniref:Transmembrane protein n=1 Tax=Rhizosaccharibacter radicis TaxID=2782605 RepID=A0ABT1W116_9PROT|nr:hypothetical protein [Acetobacteraceae bacterium KSS12]
MTPSWTIDTTAWDGQGRRVGVERGRDLATLCYVLLILAYFTAGLTGVVAAALAHLRRRAASPLARSHLDHQIRLFWVSLVVWLLIALLHALVLAFGAVTFGVGLVFMVVPWAMGVAWLCWSVWHIVAGMRRLSRSLPMR